MLILMNIIPLATYYLVSGPDPLYPPVRRKKKVEKRVFFTRFFFTRAG